MPILKSALRTKHSDMADRMCRINLCDIILNNSEKNDEEVQICLFL
jgi:hypothetical protein